MKKLVFVVDDQSLALYIGHQLASRKSPPDPFGVPEGNTQYLRTVGCLDDIPAWEKMSLSPGAGRN